MSRQLRKYQTQWACQFYVAAELTRQGYLVSLTLGNAPVADLLVVSPERHHFEVDVKGQSTKNFWLIQRREPREDLYFVLVYLPKDNESPRFFVLSSVELMTRREEYKQYIESIGGKYKDEMGSINWTTAFEYEDHWDILPR